MILNYHHFSKQNIESCKESIHFFTNSYLLKNDLIFLKNYWGNFNHLS
jgi:hypothetical protein